MKILVDECCPLSVVNALREDGHQVEYVAEEMPSLADTDILTYTVSNEQILLTEDRDFCELVFRDARRAFGIVLVRVETPYRHEKPARVRYLLAHYADDLAGHMTTLTRNNVRIRPLPVSFE